MKNKSTNNLKLAQQSILLILVIILFGSSVSCGQSGWRKPDALFNAMKIQEGSWAADVGAGDGGYTIRMAPIVKETGHVFAVDIDAGKLEELHESLEEWGVGNVTPVYSIPGNPMLPSSSLDAILVRNAYHEFGNYMSMLNHLRNSLKPGGRLVIAEPMEEEVAGQSRAQQVEEHSIALKFVLNDLKEAGFNIIKQVPRFTANQWRRYWMIIAERPD